MMGKDKSGTSSTGTIRTFLKVGTCSEAPCNVLNRAFHHPMKSEEHAAMPLAGGIMQHGYQCGLLWGAALGAGAQAYWLHGPEPRAETEAVIAAQKLVASFRERNGDINCLELTDTDWHKSMQVLRYFMKGGTIRCFRMAAKFASAAFDETNTALSEDHDEALSPPVSRAVLVAKKMGASDLRTVMAAGCAGGIGLCGGACGALGAAIWIKEMKSEKNKGSKFEFKNPHVQDVIERFLEASDYKFECSEIVGRRFENVSDHAEYMRGGGCS